MISFLNCITLPSSKISLEKKDSELLTKIFYFIDHISISLSLSQYSYFIATLAIFMALACYKSYKQMLWLI